jgi:hypothetical protein
MIQNAERHCGVKCTSICSCITGILLPTILQSFTSFRPTSQRQTQTFLINRGEDTIERRNRLIYATYPAYRSSVNPHHSQLNSTTTIFHRAAMITGLHHINLVVPPSTLHLATEFYSTTLGLTPRPVPHLQRSTLAWFDIGTSGQQVHIAFGTPEDFTTHASSRHPCFKISSVEDLDVLRRRIWEHFERGGEAAPREADRPGEKNSGAEGVEYPTRFFARDYAGNRLEFSV